MVKITSDLISRSSQYLNPIKEFQLSMRGCKIQEIENLVATKDQFGCIDFTDNNILSIPNLPKLHKLKSLILTNNKISIIEKDFAKYCPYLENLILTNNQVSKIEEINNISTCKSLVRLSLLDNMVCQIKYYRLYTIFHIPSLRFLDFQKVKLSERLEAKKIFEGKAGDELITSLIKRELKDDENYYTMFNNQMKAAQKKQMIIDTILRCSTLEDVNQIELSLKTKQDQQIQNK